MDLLTIFNLSVDYCYSQLRSHTSWRVGLLRYFYGKPCDISSDDRVNIDAVFRGYLQDRMEFDPTMGSIWFAGNRVMGPMPENAFAIEDTIIWVDAWEKRYGHGHVWIESVR